jgi:hypothetical protein
VSTSTRGACLCGAVRFAIAPPYRWFAHCHCSLCRKHHGTLFSTGLGAGRDRLEWLGATNDVVRYRASDAFERPFCRHCGSTVPGVSHDERFWHVPAGLLDGDPGARPRSHIFVASKSPLHELADALPKHAAYPPGIDPPALERRSAKAPTVGTIEGSCLCGRIAFAVTASPRRLVNCYCAMCRRRSGAGFTSTLPTTTTDFSWLRGEAGVRHFSVNQTPGSSGSERLLHYGADFCVDCGSPVPSVAATTVMLPAGAIDDPWKSPNGVGDLEPLPAVHLNVAAKAPWVTITDTWPQFDELPPAERLKAWFQ